MIVSAMAAKVAMSALVVLIVVMCLDEANGSWHGRSPLWIALPGAIAGITFLGAGLIALIAVIWGL